MPTPRYVWVLLVASVALLVVAARAASAPAPADPVPHAVITQPYRVCQGLEELTGRIDNLYRKPFAKVYREGVAQPETVYFKDTVTGHEIIGLTRELCADISHPDLKRPAWTVDGAHVLFMGNRGFYTADGALKKAGWPGWKFVMDADYTRQRPLIVRYLDENGGVRKRDTGIDGKFNALDRKDPRYAYYAVGDTLWRVTIGTGTDEATAFALCKFATPHPKFIQDISDDNLLLIQDNNAEFVAKEKRSAYAPEIHLVDLNKGPGEAGFYAHHPFDYGLPQVKDADGKVLHEAKNNKDFHSLMFGGAGASRGKSITWNYGSMLVSGDYVGFTLDVRQGLDGTPTHTDVGKGSAVNKWGQAPSHGGPLGGGSAFRIYFAGPAKVAEKEVGGWGLWLEDTSRPQQPPTFLLRAGGGHEANSKCQDPDLWGAFVARTPDDWKPPVPEADGLIAGDTAGHWSLVCYTYSDARGGIKKDRAGNAVAWSGPDNNDWRPYSSIPRPLLSPDGTKMLFHSCMLQPLEEWNGLYVATVRRPMPPVDLSLAEGGGDAGAVRLQWRAERLAHEIKGYHVYRGDGEGKNFVEVTDRATDTRAAGEPAAFTYTDRAAAAGAVYTYVVTAEEWSTLESDVTSNVLRVGGAGPARGGPGPPVRGWDRTPPQAVRQFRAVREPDAAGQYRLSWAGSPEKDLRYYNVYFSAAGRPQAKQARLIASPPAAQTEFLDWSAPPAGPAYYAITAVDRQGNESEPAFADVP